jgi:hypothetical protein
VLNKMTTSVTARGRVTKPTLGAAGIAALALGLGALGAHAQTATRPVNPADLTVFPPNDDSSTDATPLGFTLNFFGRLRTEAFVNNNGNITLDEALSTFTPFELTTTGREIIAPFFADVDTSSAGSPVRYGQTVIGGRRAFVVNYLDVDYFPSDPSHTNRNSFQLVVIDRSDIANGDADIEFNYDSIQWEAGRASGSDENGLGGSTARVGWSNGSGLPGTFFELPGSGIPGAFLDGGPAGTALVRNSLGSNVLGRYVFAVRNGTINTVDLAGFSATLTTLADDTTAAQAEQQGTVNRMMTQGFLVNRDRNGFSVLADVRSTGQNVTTVGPRTTSLAALSFGRGVTDRLTLGATISAQGASLENNAFRMNAGPALALWAVYSEGGAARTGLQFDASLGFATNSGEVERGRLLAGVVPATGQSTIETRAFNASLGYGFRQGTWLLTPTVAVAHFATTRSAYTETGPGFTASYDAMHTNRTVVTVGLTANTAIGEQGRLSLGAGVEHDLSTDAVRLTGTSTIPGLATFDIPSAKPTNQTRGFAAVGYSHDLGNGHSLSGNLRVANAVYGSTMSVGVSVNYVIRF